MRNKINSIVQSLLAVQMIVGLAGCSSSQNKKPELPEEAYEAQQTAMQAEEEKKASIDAMKQTILDKLTATKESMGDYNVYQLGEKYYTLGKLDGTAQSQAKQGDFDSVHYTTFDSSIPSSSDVTGKQYNTLNVVAVDKDQLNDFLDQNYDFAQKFASNVKAAFDSTVSQQEAGNTDNTDAVGQIPQIDENVVKDAAKSVFSAKDAVQTDMKVLDENGNEYPVMQVDFVVDTSTLGVSGLDTEYVYKTVYYIDGDQCLVFDSNSFDYVAAGTEETKQSVEIALANVMSTVQSELVSELIANPAMTADDIKTSLITKLVAVAGENTGDTETADETSEQTTGTVESALKTSLDALDIFNESAVEFANELLNGKVYIGNMDNMPQSIDDIEVDLSQATPESATPESAK